MSMGRAVLVVLTSVVTVTHARADAAPDPACGDHFAYQVLLDTHGFSPGQIDGKPGSNTTRALRAFQETQRLPVTGRPDCATWKALEGDTAQSTISYTITEADVAGPFTPSIPDTLPEQSALTALAYRNVEELIAERFHVSPAWLKLRNADVALTVGASIVVPNVAPFDAVAKPVREAALGALTIEVTKAGTLTVRRPDGQILFFAPVSSGSAHDPLPTGAWKVTGVGWRPPFHYNPDLFWDAKATDNKSTIQPGPNNPVGVVWIDLNLDHYGLHGTPEPGRIGYAQSHGCVRLTNWDAARVAGLVGPGTAVTFK
jgi:lipoprotein-anchoring transpeptidase ErfK/SrfK